MPPVLRPARPDDIATILRFIRELAVYEEAGHEVEASEEDLAASLFSPGAVAHAILAEEQGQPIGFALWFYSFSTWQAKKGLYLEDLYVTPEARGSGAGRAMLQHLAKLALAEGCGRFEWSVLDWNEPAIRVYRRIGAEPLDEWTRYRLSGAALTAFAEG
ncbi:GNAT family N-acetyltransferase [Rhizobium rhizosphaerae]|uniref:GNAT family N-acetyltransferase n=1 Tax=Xaviernesmea rhizosphaerae TaxID=1672749 RepID=A0ABX3PD40_9HYPH|nr:GNAT family N-acetyltransferase [Xaviernesmea rhizosphaerae]OQP85967.1 GNAT family N-acetyltransferase [Xaviernesmea rhizosphaerae]